MSAIVCDSCVMQHYAEAMVNGTAGSVTVLIQKILESHAFALDSGEKIQHQWLETCGAAFGEQFYLWLREGKIQYFEPVLHEQHRKHLVVKCGFPYHQRFEGVFVATSAVAFPHILVCDDMDFWEPKEKGCSAERRAEIMSHSKGAVCRYLNKATGVQVVTIDQAIPLLAA